MYQTRFPHLVADEFAMGRHGLPPDLDAGLGGGHALQVDGRSHQVLLRREHQVLAVGARPFVRARSHLKKQNANVSENISIFHNIKRRVIKRTIDIKV
jgi:hypothetical protein